MFFFILYYFIQMNNLYSYSYFSKIMTIWCIVQLIIMFTLLISNINKSSFLYLITCFFFFLKISIWITLLMNQLNGMCIHMTNFVKIKREASQQIILIQNYSKMNKNSSISIFFNNCWCYTLNTRRNWKKNYNLKFYIISIQFHANLKRF